MASERARGRTVPPPSICASHSSTSSLAVDHQVGLRDLVIVEELQIGIFAAVPCTHHGEWRDAVAVGIVAQQRTQRGGGDIGATAHGFGEDDFGRVRGHAIERVDQVREAAAEAAAGHLVGGQRLRLHEAGIHEVAALIVEDDGDARPRRCRMRAAARISVVLPAPRNPPTTAMTGFTGAGRRLPSDVRLGVKRLPFTVQVLHSSVP